MTLQLLPYVVPLLVATLLFLGFTAVAWPHRDLPGVRWFLGFLVGMVIWTLSYAAELALDGREAMIWSAKVQYLGIASVPLAWFAFAVDYAGVGWLTRRNLIALAMVPAATMIMAWTNEATGLIWAAVDVLDAPAFRVLDLEYGAWFWVHVVYSYLCLLLAAGLLLRVVLVRPPLFRRQATLLFLAGLAPWLGNVLYLTDLSPAGLDLTVFGFVLSGLIAGWAILRWRLLSIGPIARDTIVEGMGEGVVVIDREARIVDANPAASRIVEVPSEKLVGALVDEALGEFAPKLDPAKGTRASVKGGDAARSYDCVAEPLRGERGRPRGWTLVIYDVTAREAEAAALEGAREVAEQTAQAQRAFMTNMNHELRTPLNGVMGMLDLLLASDLDSEQREWTEMAESSAEELLGLVSRILDFTAASSGAIRLLEKVFLVEATVRAVVERHRPSASSRGLELAFTAGDGVPASVVGDPARLSQVLDCLLSNAVKFTSRGSIHVRLHAERKSDDEAWIRFEVQDTGIGIPKHRLADVFKSFIQADASLTREHEGAGLGLALAQKLVVRMGGGIEVESEVGKGSTFWFTLPMKRADRAEP